MGGERRDVSHVYAIRCTSSHSIPVDTTLLFTPLLASMTQTISPITHVTMTIHLANLFRLLFFLGGDRYEERVET
eukprot:4767514-Heterocapsa_arctica.AAC.1